MQKFSLEDIKNIAIERGGQCLSEKYINPNIPLRWCCSVGHEWITPFKYIKYHNRWCTQCLVLNRQSRALDIAKNIAYSKGGACLSDKFINSKTPLDWRCSAGHEWTAHFHSIKGGVWCFQCYKNIHYHNLNIARNLAMVKGGECLSEKYVNVSSPLHWKCAYGHEWFASLANIKNRGSWCPHCYKNKVYNHLDDIKKLAQSRGGECLSDIYINGKIPLLWKCSNGHKWPAKLEHVQNSRSWCPFCSKYNREHLCRDIIKKNIRYSASTVRRPDFLKTTEHPYGLELDIYYPQYGFAIEVQGIQHTQYHKFFHKGDLNNFLNQQKRDRDKKELCDENDIYLFYIYHDDEDPEKTIRDELWALGLIN